MNTSIQVIVQHDGHRVDITTPVLWDADDVMPLGIDACQAADETVMTLIRRMVAEGHEFDNEPASDELDTPKPRTDLEVLEGAASIFEAFADKLEAPSLDYGNPYTKQMERAIAASRTIREAVRTVRMLTPEAAA